MKFMLMFKSDEPVQPGTSACKENLPEMAKLMGELKAKGTVVASEALLPPDTGARLRLTGGKVNITDGPFAEAKEMVAGFAIVNVGSKAEAVAIAGRFLEIAGSGECDITEVFDAPTAGH
ncbi:MAG TPA: YciI family protein [Tepidisphaeraceae bacterium]|jgi:hypothetical protein|nr:YciI family protein [Tepidisphaeraceae bacterium]